jgi:hypothetical protein
MSAAHLKGPAVARVVCIIPPGCSGKVQFATPRLAVKALRRNPLNDNGKAHYRCHACGQWHISGSAPLAGNRKATNALMLVRRE